MKKDEFVKIDLHIHTPASSCYKGKKDNEEYLHILRQAKKKKLKIIAITDHNSILGYKKLKTLKANLLEGKITLSKITDSKQTKLKLNDIKKKLKMFEDILILPGVEFEVSNGIHLLVVFSETVQLEQMQKFLIEGGYEKETFGKEEPMTRAKWDIFDLYEESKKYDCILIDAHTDSDKGIWKTVPRGRTRANCFRDAQLCAVGFKNENQKEKILSILNTSEEYKRTTPLSFVRFSDAHDCSEVGSQVTWVKLKKINFTSLKKAFENPRELVSTESPSLERILDRLINEEITFGVTDLSKLNLERCKKLICALNNSSGGHLLFGVTPEMSKVGLQISEKDNNALGEAVKQIVKNFTTITGGLSRREKIEINVYPMQNRRVILSVQVLLGNELASIDGDGRIYSIQNKELKVLSGRETQALIEERTTRSIEKRIFQRMCGIEKDCQLMRSFFASMPIIRKFESRSIHLPVRTEVAKSIVLSNDNVKKLRDSNYHGKSKGNLFFLKEGQSPRLKYAYLRYSVPLFNVRGIGIKTENVETIFMVPGGGVYYSQRNYPFFGEERKIILKLLPLKRELYSHKFLTAFLKSSFLLWYVMNKMDEDDLFLHSIYKSILVPKLEKKLPSHVEITKKIESNVENIMELEKEFLIDSQRIRGKKLMEFIEEHNRKVDKVAYAIDNEVFKLVGLSSEEISTVESYLNLKDVYLPKKVGCIVQDVGNEKEEIVF